MQQCTLITDGRDCDGNALIPGFIYGLYAEGRSPAFGGTYCVWDGEMFLDDMTGDPVFPQRESYTRAMLMSPAMA